ncbi:MAG: hypothetical protein AMJ69_01635 [Gammaproteobacteria bacterium SG8_47]|nr:MAG: hypothetical protein AMJ69_01635 [Gammaproteobacteria bacterium SG8_47]
MNPDSSNLDPAWNVGVNLGWRIPNYDYFAIEGELTTSLLSGDVKSTNDDWTVSNVAAYGVFRAGSPKVMFKGKLGLGYWDLRVDDGPDDDGVDLTAGVGVDIALGGGLLEIEYTQIEPDLAFITAGFVFGFF